jgi:predicted NAD/FAD-binding protein
MQKNDKLRIAVVGAGVAGITAAYLLQKKHKITLYEKNDYIGGHTHTIMVDESKNKQIPVDTGFIVFNDHTYPLLNKLLERLNVDKCNTGMSFSYFDSLTNFIFSTRNLNSLFAQRKRILQPTHWKFIKEIINFGKITKKEFSENRIKNLTLDEYLLKHHFSSELRDNFVLPMAGAIWSAPDSTIAKFPMLSFASFYNNHGLLNVFKHPQWHFVKGGSHSYVNKFLSQFTGTVIKNDPVIKVKKSKHNTKLTTQSGIKEEYDYIIIAAHADETLKMLKNPTNQEKDLLGTWQYSRNHTFLHTDTRLMPELKRAWAAWNYQRNKDVSNSNVTVTYYINMLQNIKSKTPYLVTLNPAQPILQSLIIKDMVYHHPIYKFESLATQKELPSLNQDSRTLFCGSYFGYGFHEDAVRSGVEVAKLFGETL